MSAGAEREGAPVLRPEHVADGLPSTEAGITVWALVGAHRGDNEQIRHLARRLGWPTVEKTIDAHALRACPNLLLGGTLATLRGASRAEIRPPWPDLVILAGRRSVPIARWIRRRSGGRTRIVALGRPRAPLAWFDLLVTTPQYGLPARRNVLHNLLPVNRVEEDPAASERLREAIAACPTPRTALLVGGSSWPFVLDAETAARLGEAVSREATRRGGSLLVTTSPRTSPAAADALLGSLAAPRLVHRFEGAAPNPYATFLAAADDFVVTADSASMIADACATGRPVAVAELPVRSVGRLVSRLVAGATVPPLRRGPWAWLAASGLLTPPRDLDRLRAALREARLVSSFGPGRRLSPSNLPEVELQRTLRRVRELVLDDGSAARPARTASVRGVA